MDRAFQMAGFGRRGGVREWLPALCFQGL